MHVAMQTHAGLEQREAIAGLFDRWNEALATLNPATVADMYWPDAVLLPTVSNEVSGHEQACMGPYLHTGCTRHHVSVATECCLESVANRS
jgi:uncharacterized protein (TIGR02246 family)